MIMTQDEMERRAGRIARMVSEISGGLTIAVDLCADKPAVCDMLSGMLRIAELAAGEIDVLEGVAHD